MSNIDFSIADRISQREKDKQVNDFLHTARDEIRAAFKDLIKDLGVRTESLGDSIEIELMWVHEGKEFHVLEVVSTQALLQLRDKRIVIKKLYDVGKHFMEKTGAIRHLH